MDYNETISFAGIVPPAIPNRSESNVMIAENGDVYMSISVEYEVAGNGIDFVDLNFPKDAPNPKAGTAESCGCFVIAFNGIKDAHIAVFTDIAGINKIRITPSVDVFRGIYVSLRYEQA